MAEERNRLRKIFDEAAPLYDEARPGYPDELFDDVVSLSGIPFEGRILEIGCGTGQATVPFAHLRIHSEVAAGEGGHIFADTFAQHQANVAKWYAIRRQRGEM